MKFERTIRLRITDWPRFNRTTTFELDEAIFPPENREHALREHAHQLFGDGVLRRISDDEWEFQRKIAGPRLWWNALSTLLNKSYA